MKKIFRISFVCLMLLSAVTLTCCLNRNSPYPTVEASNTISTLAYTSETLPSAQSAIPNTPTPSPTLVVDFVTMPPQDYTLLSKLIENNAGCELPCFWGITPGTTKWQESLNIINGFGLKGTIGITLLGNNEYYVTHSNIGSDLSIYLTIYRKEDTVGAILVDFQGLNEDGFSSHQFFYSPGRLIQGIGIPSSFLVETSSPPEGPNNSLSYKIWMDYKNNGIQLAYIDRVVDIANPEVCLNDRSQEIFLYLTNNGFEPWGQNNIDKAQLLESVAQITSIEFSKLIKQGKYPICAKITR